RFIPAEGADEHIRTHQVVVCAGEFLNCASADVTVELHLPPAILRVGVALREEEIVQGAGVDVGDTPFVTEDFNLILQAGDIKSAAYSGERSLCGVVIDEETADSNDDDDEQQ